MKSKYNGGKKRDRVERQHAEKIYRQQRRGESRKRIAHLIRALSDGKVEPDAALVDTILTLRLPEPRVLADRSLLSIPGHQAVLNGIRRALDTMVVEILPHLLSIPLRRFYSDYLPIIRMAKTECAYAGKLRRAQLILADHVLQYLDENVSRADKVSSISVLGRLLAHWRMDGVFYSAESVVEGETPIIKIAARKPTPTSFVRAGEERPAWRCVVPPGMKGPSEWVSWTAEIRGAPPGSPPADVFVQSHALHNLRQRIPFANGYEAVLEACTWMSLERPTLIPHGPKEWLVEFHIGGKRLGYFTAVEMDGRILITTFLFLTMRGTPEGRRIRQRLGLRAEQIEWLRMDALPYFTQSDAGEDSEIRAVLSECGCGHLFDIIEPEAREITIRGKARETRRHLGLPIPDFLPAFCSPVPPDAEEAGEEGRESDPDDHNQQANDNATDTPVGVDGLRRAGC